MVLVIVILVTGAAAAAWAAVASRRRDAKARALAVRAQDAARARQRAAQRLEAARDPPLLRRMRASLAALESGGALVALLDVGDMYARGEYPQFAPDRRMAMAVYMAAAACPDPAVSSAARTRSVECRMAMAVEDVAGSGIPAAFGQRAIASATRAILAARAPAPARTAGAAGAAAPEDGARPAPAIGNDRQNVHDHGVMSGMKRRLALLEDRPDTGEGDVTARVVMCVLESPGLDAATKSDALEVVASLGDSEHSALGISETGALARVWEAVRDDPDAREILVRQLASGIESGHVVCSTGKIARILATMDGISSDADDAVLRPVWAIREELATLAAKTRAEVEAGDDDAEAARALFRRRAADTYVHGLGMSAALLDPIVAEYELGF